jgi:hypothetical protein
MSGSDGSRRVVDGMPTDGPPTDMFVPFLDAMVDLDQAIVNDAAPDMFMGECRRNSDCDDELFCNGTEQCSNNRCYASPVSPCDDNVRCTADTCNEADLSCATEPDDSQCPPNFACDRKLGCFPMRIGSSKPLWQVALS